MRDVQELGRGVVVGQGDWRARLDSNRNAFIDAWVKRRDFAGDFDGTGNRTYVEKLFFRAGLSSDAVPNNPDMEALIAALDAGTKTRTQVLLDVIDLPAMNQRHFVPAFVLMEYFGYLRRNPEDPPDGDRGGYNFWESKLFQAGGDFLKAEMVKAFISSDEYRRRFGP